MSVMVTVDGTVMNVMALGIVPIVMERGILSAKPAMGLVNAGNVVERAKYGVPTVMEKAFVLNARVRKTLCVPVVMAVGGISPIQNIV